MITPLFKILPLAIKRKCSIISNLLNSLFLFFLSLFRHIVFLQFQNQNSPSYIQNKVPAACYTSLYGKIQLTLYLTIKSHIQSGP